MKRVIFAFIIAIFFASLNCSKCSKDEASKAGSQNPSTEKVSESPVVSDAEMSAVFTDAGTGSNIIYPNIKFVETPDGKLVPEAAFRLKLPKMLNSTFLKNIVNDQGNKENNEERDSTKERKE